MPRQVILPFLIYSFITSITPGPANLCSLSTALHYGKATALRQWRGLYSLYGMAPSANRGGRAEWRAAAAKLSNRSAAESEQCESHSLLSHSDEFFCTSVYRFPPCAVRHRPSPYCYRTVLQSDLADRRRGTAKILREISKDGGYHHGNLTCPLCGQSCHPTWLTDLVSKKLSGST